MRKKCILRLIFVIVTVTVLPSRSGAATKVHVIAFGKWMSVQWLPDSAGHPVPLKVRALVVDGRVKEYAAGTPHEVTERLFVVRRVYRMNDSLPEDSAPRWQWQRGGWLLVDRMTGHISMVNLSEFDVVYSPATWYRDYVAYCGVSDDGNKRFAIVAELNRRKPVLKKPLAGAIPDDAAADSACSAPVWQRSPARVSFEVPGADKQTFAIRGHVADMVSDAEEDEEASK